MVVDVADSNIVYVIDTTNHRVRKVTLSTGAVVVYAGSTSGFVNNVNPLSAKFNSPAGTAMSADGTLWVADTGNHAYVSCGATNNNTLTATTHMPRRHVTQDPLHYGRRRGHRCGRRRVRLCEQCRRHRSQVQHPDRHGSGLCFG